MQRRKPLAKKSVLDGRVTGRIVSRLKRTYRHTVFVDNHGRDPYRVLIGCVLSLRTKDEVSYPATDRLFQRAANPAEMLRLRASTISRLIYPVGFYRTKARQIREISRQILDRFGGTVPGDLDELLTLPGVGRKTANLVVTLAFNKPGICVDTHVHRISNRLGWVHTPTPEKTEFALREILPRRYWIVINELLVRHGRETCKPISPLCSHCVIRDDCSRTGVDRSR
jgi:endonuclease-3